MPYIAALTLLLQTALLIPGVPFIHQKSRFCGPASLASVMQFYGQKTDQDQIAEEVFSPGLRGSLITDLQNYAIRSGFSTELKTGDRDEIEKNISRGRPVIVLVDTGFWVFESPHYLVVTGYDADHIRLHTGYEANALWKWRHFFQTWERAGNLMLVVWKKRAAGATKREPR